MTETIEWIVPRRQLPEDGEMVLVCFLDARGQGVREAVFELTDGSPEWYIGDCFQLITQGVIAWARMPRGRYERETV